MEIQFRALRDALDQAGRTAQSAEEATRKARAELHTERTKSSCFQFKIEDLTRKLNEARRELKSLRDEVQNARTDAKTAREDAKVAREETATARENAGPAREEFQQLIEENKRLRSNVGELCQERDELKKICKDYGAPTKPGEAAPTTMVIGFDKLRPEPKSGTVTIG